jgi:SAM-dependent methyltransferase
MAGEGISGAATWPYVVCDEPEAGATVTQVGRISGWAYSPAGVRKVAVSLGGRRVEVAERGIARPDVAADHPTWPNAEPSGFACSYELDGHLLALARQTELVIEVEDEAGRRAEVRRSLRIDDPTTVALWCDEPADGAPVTLGDTISGWAYSPAHLRTIELWLGGEAMGMAEQGIERRDVAADHPEWPRAMESGFRYRLSRFPGPPYPQESELLVVAEDEAGRRAELRRAVTLVTPPLTMDGSLDIPKLRQPLDPLREAGWSSPLVAHGWAFDPGGVERIDVLLDDRVVAEAEYGVPREDVEVLRPEYRGLGLAARSGWLAVVPTEGLADGRHQLSAVIHGASGSHALGPTPVWLRATSVRTNQARRERMEALLRCPACGGGLERTAEGLVCAGCDRTIRENDFGTLLFDETYAGLDWREAVATSHGYPREVGDMITAVADGLILDIGAGLRENLENVIQLDAIAFPTTDVAANAESLPFADASFDGVVACALLEHVSVPFDVIKEVRRVCKIGGWIHVDWVAVHPYHGFPHQYFNATESGLAWAMRELGGAEGVVGLTDPRITVRLVLQNWLGSLEDPEARARVGGLTVGELVALLEDPEIDAHLFKALNAIYPDGRRLLPPKVTFTGVRAR